MFKKSLLFFESGQSMLEIMILLTILVVATSTVAVVSINSIKNSQFSKSQLQATQLAQEGIDKVKIGRSKNCPVTIGGNSYNWYDTAPLIWDISLSTEVSFKVDLPQPPSLCNFTELVSANESDPIPVSTSTQFKRKITLIDDGVTDRKKVKSEVSWTDHSGKHNSVIVTILTKN